MPESPAPHSNSVRTRFRSHMPQMNMVQAINEGLRLEMKRDPRVVVLGEDVGKVGGVFRVTAGLHEEFGDDRVRSRDAARYAGACRSRGHLGSFVGAPFE